MQHTCKIFLDNIQRIKQYFGQVLSPLSLVNLIKDVNIWVQDSLKAKGQ